MTEFNSATYLDLDIEFYHAIHPDLHGMSAVQLRNHYRDFGEGEGRYASPLAVRGGLLGSIGAGQDVLEIGPFTEPLLRGDRVKYFDVLDRTRLIERAARIGRRTDNAPEIDFVSPTGDLSIVADRSFDAVLSCHCIEHQPDLVRHLNEISRILRPGGAYFLIVPDKRYCFDHFIAASTVAGVLQAHYEGRRVHNLASILEHRILTTHNDSARHWAGDHGVPVSFENIGAIRQAIEEFENAAGGYVDVHAWQFTPRSFRDLLSQLYAAEFITLQPAKVFGTPGKGQEFCAILSQDATRRAAP